MKKIIEVLCSILILSSYLKLISSIGAASIFMIRRWSMLKPLSIVFVNESVDCLAVAFTALILSILLTYKYRTFPSFLFIFLSILSIASSTLTLYQYSMSLSLIVGFLMSIYITLVKKETTLALIFRWLLVLLIIFEVLGFSGWLLYLLHGGINPYTEPTSLQDLEAKIAYSLSPLTPVFMTIFMLSIFLIAVAKPLKPIEGGKPAEQLGRVKAFLEDVAKNMGQHAVRYRPWNMILLSSSLILPVFAVFLLYSPIVNPSSMTVSVDIVHYVNYLNQVRGSSENSLEILSSMLGRDRPLTLLVIYSISILSGLDFKTVSIYLPIILSPLLIFSIYYLALTLFRDRLYSSLTCFLTAAGPFTTASLYGGFLANWLGLSLAYLSLAMMIKSIEQGSVRLLTASILLSILSHLAHPVPWNFLILATILAALPSLRKHSSKRVLKLMATFIIINILYDLLKTRVFGFAGATAVAQSIISTELTVNNLVNFWPINVFMTYFHVGGAFNLPPTYFSALIGMVLFNLVKSFKLDILKMWVVAGLPLYLLGPDYVQARTLQNIPVDFFASAGLLAISNYLSARDKLSQIFFIAFIYLLYLNNLLRFTVNLPF